MLAARHQDELAVQVRDRALSYAEVIPVECYRTVDWGRSKRPGASCDPDPQHRAAKRPELLVTDG